MVKLVEMLTKLSQFCLSRRMVYYTETEQLTETPVVSQFCLSRRMVYYAKLVTGNALQLEMSQFCLSRRMVYYRGNRSKNNLRRSRNSALAEGWFITVSPVLCDSPNNVAILP